MKLRMLNPLLLLVFIFSAIPAAAASPAASSFDETPQPGGLLSITAGSTYAAYFPGVPPAAPFDPSGYIELSNMVNPFFAPASTTTIEAWIQRSGSSRQETIIGNNIDQSFWFGITSAGKLAFSPKGSANLITSNATIPTGSWVHVAVVYTYNAQKFYINGALDVAYSANMVSIGSSSDSVPVSIGYDRSNAVGANYFYGYIDELRIWRTGRTPDEIQAGMFTTAGGPANDLYAAYSLDGSAADATGSYNGVVKGGGLVWSNNGALPKNLVVPASGSPTLNGLCGATEYTGATYVAIRGMPVAIQRTATDLWVCMGDIGASAITAYVFLDPNLTRQDPAGAEHLRLSVNASNVRTSSVGNGSGSFLTDTSLDTLWDAHYANTGGEFPTYYAEFRISQSLLGGSWDLNLGMAFGKAGTSFPSILYTWPALAISNQPSTWSTVQVPGDGPLRTFSGSVVYRPPGAGAAEQGIGAIPVRLWASNPATSQEIMVGSVLSAFNGAFTIQTTSPFPNYRLELGAPPKGLSSYAALAGPGAVVVDERTIDYGAQPGGTYANSKFSLVDQAPLIVDALNGPIYTIIASKSILQSGALSDFIAFKQSLGFTVETAALEDIAKTYGDSTPAVIQIRSYLQARRAFWGALRYKYVLLIGSQSTIPHAPIAAGITGSGTNTCENILEKGGPSYKWSDWLYVDLTSNADSNGNGCFADGVYSNVLSFAPGYLPDNFAFHHDVSVGRIGSDDAEKVKKALSNSMAFERQSKAYKQNFLAAHSMAVLEGYLDGDPCPDLWGERCMAPSISSNFDFAMLANKINGDILDLLGYDFTALYESESIIAGGSGLVSSPTLNETNVIAALNSQSRGWVNIAAHGSGYGTGRVFWEADKNNNGRMDFSYTESQSEVGGGFLFTLDSAANTTPRNGNAPVFFFMACSTADPEYNGNIASGLLNNGYSVATFGATSVVTVGSWWQPSRSNNLALTNDYFVTKNVLIANMRLGDALWVAQRWMYTGGARSSAFLAYTLFGDPSLSFQGNPGASAASAPWAMARRESRGQAYFALPGPENPKTLWSAVTNATPLGGPQKPAPVVGRSRNVIVPAGSTFREYVNGSLVETLSLDAPAFGSAAIGSDNTIYALDTNGKLYSFAFQDYYDFFQPKTHARRWTASLGGAPTASPIIGPDGSILVMYGSPSKLKVFRPDGNLQTTYTLSGNAVGEPVMDAYQHVYVASNFLGAGYLTMYQLSCTNLSGGCAPVSRSLSLQFSTPPLVAYGSVYVGRLDGSLQRFNPLTLESQGLLSLGSAISAGPVVGPGSQVLVGTQGGKLVSLTATLNKRWEINLGEPIISTPAFSTDALYLVINGELKAYNPASGASLWSRSLSGGSGAGSAVPGYGRTVFALDGAGKLWAFGEGWLNGAIDIVIIPGTISSRVINEIKWLLNPPGTSGQAAGDSAISAVSAVSGILLQRSLDGAAWEDIAFLPADTLEYTDTDITGGGSYRYRIQLVDAAGFNSDYTISEEVTALPELPDTPTLDSVSPLSSDSLHIAWTPALTGGEVTGYIIERGPTSGGPFNPLAIVFDPASEYTDTGLSPLTTYYYRITPFNENGNGSATAPLSGATFAQTLAAPTDLLAALSAETQVTLTYAGRPAAAQAVIEYRPAGASDWLPLATLAANTFSHFVDPGDGFQYRVRYIQGSVDSPWAYSNALTIPLTRSLFIPAVMR